MRRERCPPATLAFTLACMERVGMRRVYGRRVGVGKKSNGASVAACTLDTLACMVRARGGGRRVGRRK